MEILFLRAGLSAILYNMPRVLQDENSRYEMLRVDDMKVMVTVGGGMLKSVAHDFVILNALQLSIWYEVFMTEVEEVQNLDESGSSRRNLSRGQLGIF